MRSSVLVRFTKADSPYAVGEEKECTQDEAEKLVRHGVAILVDQAEKAHAHKAHAVKKR